MTLTIIIITKNLYTKAMSILKFYYKKAIWGTWLTQPVSVQNLNHFQEIVKKQQVRTIFIRKNVKRYFGNELNLLMCFHMWCFIQMKKKTVKLKDYAILMGNEDVVLLRFGLLLCIQRLSLIDSSKSECADEMILKFSYENGWLVCWQWLRMDEWSCVCKVLPVWYDMPWCSSALVKRWRIVFPMSAALQLLHL